MSDVVLRPWSEDDFDLLRRTNTAEMTKHLGGPETEQALIDRHARYLTDTVDGTMFRVELPAGEVVGSTGFWGRDWAGEAAYETGYAILPEYHGRGLAVAALMAVTLVAQARDTHRYLYAFPSRDHSASNAVCRGAGFDLVGQSEFEYPEGNLIDSNVWRFDLTLEPLSREKAKAFLRAQLAGSDLVASLIADRRAAAAIEDEV